jgi:hypothetical protein
MATPFTLEQAGLVADLLVSRGTSAALNRTGRAWAQAARRRARRTAGHVGREEQVFNGPMDGTVARRVQAYQFATDTVRGAPLMDRYWPGLATTPQGMESPAVRDRVGWNPVREWARLVPPDMPTGDDMAQPRANDEPTGAQIRLLVETCHQRPDFRAGMGRLLTWVAAWPDGLDAVNLILNDRPVPTADPSFANNSPLIAALASNRPHSAQLIMAQADVDGAVGLAPHAPEGPPVLQPLGDIAVVESRILDEGPAAVAVALAHPGIVLTADGIHDLWDHEDLELHMHLDGNDGLLLETIARLRPGHTLDIVRYLLAYQDDPEMPAFVFDRLVGPGTDVTEIIDMAAAGIGQGVEPHLALDLLVRSRDLGYETDGVDGWLWWAIQTNHGTATRSLMSDAEPSVSDLRRAAVGDDTAALEALLDCPRIYWTDWELKSGIHHHTSPAARNLLLAQLLARNPGT